MSDIQTPTPSDGATPAPNQSALPSIEPKKDTATKTALTTVIIVLLVGAVLAGAYFLPRMFMTRQTAPSTVQTIPPAEPAQPAEASATQPVVEQPSATSTAPTATSTPEAVATSTPAANQPTNIAFGQTIQMFAGDEVTLGDKTRSYRIKAAEFTDSRCPAGVQCIWAGERGVRLEVTDLLSGKEEDMKLGMVTAKAANVMGLTGTLIGIDDEKGGPYAQIKFN